MAPKQAPDAKPLPSRAVSAAVLGMMAPRRLAKPKAAASPRTSEATTPSGPSEFAVKVTLSETVALGIDVDWADGRTLLVKAVNGGAMRLWNARNAATAVHPGDRIINVNGYTGDAVVMVNECRTSRQLSLTLRTHRVLAKATEGDDAPSAKKARESTGNSLYAGMPAPDPKKDEDGAIKAKEADIFAEAAAKEDASRVVFLDMDGVLRKLEDALSINVNGETLPLHLHTRFLAPEAMRALKYIVHRTGASIVLSSEWRRSPQLTDEVAMALRAVGIPAMRGATVVLEAREEIAVNNPSVTDKASHVRLCWAERRAREISQWLEEHPDVHSWCALDDLDLSLADKVRLPVTLLMAPNLVLTSGFEGLTLGDARRAIRRLQRKPAPSG